MKKSIFQQKNVLAKVFKKYQNSTFCLHSLHHHEIYFKMLITCNYYKVKRKQTHSNMLHLISTLKYIDVGSVSKKSNFDIFYTPWLEHFIFSEKWTFAYTPYTIFLIYLKYIYNYYKVKRKQTHSNMLRNYADVL